MRCFFHLLNGSSAIRDDEGVDVLDLDQAREDARAVIDDVRRDEAEIYRGWTLTVTDSSARPLFSVPLIGS